MEQERIKEFARACFPNNPKVVKRIVKEIIRQEMQAKIEKIEKKGLNHTRLTHSIIWRRTSEGSTYWAGVASSKDAVSDDELDKHLPKNYVDEHPETW